MALVAGKEKYTDPDSWAKSSTSQVEITKHHVDALRSRFKDLAKPNLFKAEITGPTGIDLENASYMVKSVSIPQNSINKIALKRMGTTFNLPGDIEYPDITLTFWLDEQMDLKAKLLRWQKYYAFNWVSNLSGLFSESWNSKILIHQLNSNYEKVQTVVYTHCWPTSIGEIAYSHESVDTRLELTATFCYSGLDYME